MNCYYIDKVLENMEKQKTWAATKSEPEFIFSKYYYRLFVNCSTDTVSKLVHSFTTNKPLNVHVGEYLSVDPEECCEWRILGIHKYVYDKDLVIELDVERIDYLKE